jgi:hypothetical protein
LRKRAKFADVGGELNAFGTARPGEIRLDRHCADSRDLEQVGQCTVCRLLQLHRGLHPRGVGSETDLVVAPAVGAMCGYGRGRIQHRAHVRRPSHEKERAHARKLGSELERLDRDLIDIDMWHAGTTALLGRLAHRLTFDRQPCELQSLDLQMSCEQRKRRPAQRDALCSEPDTVLVSELQPREVDGRRKGTRQTRELHVTGGKTSDRALDQRATARGVSCDPNRCHERHDDGEQRADDPGADSRGATHQNACPRPM